MMENPIKMDDMGVPLETPIWISTTQFFIRFSAPLGFGKLL